jgi:predicted esterase
MTEPRLVEPGDGRLAYRVRAGASPALLLLHGLSGDEGVMWVLETALPVGCLMVSPRGLFPYAEGGYSWVPGGQRGLPAQGSFAESVSGVRQLMRDLTDPAGRTGSAWILVGFSQGAALAFAVANHLPRQPMAIVALAAFLPEGEWGGIRGVPVYWGHGTQDERVPIVRARRDVARLRAAGAEVTLCETHVGHKLGIECLRGLKTWLAETLPRMSES